MVLKQLIGNIQVKQIIGDTNMEIHGINQDSRQVERGDLFICIRGSKVDSHQFLSQVAALGAVAALVEHIPEETFGLTLIQVDDTNEVIREVAGAFYDYPDRKLQLIGVVGTNGKTTSTYLMKSILEAAGHRVGLIGTIANIINDRVYEAHNTTPGPLDLQKLFAQMVQAGVEYAVMEVSSHSIHQGRVAGLSFRSGIFTNITQDHLDYHRTFAEYLRVKSLFFKNLPSTSWAAINADDQQAESIINQTAANTLTYGINNTADVQAKGIQLTADGVKYSVTTPKGQLDLNLYLTGYFNVYNSLGVLTAAICLGIDLPIIKKGLEGVEGVPGRFQRVAAQRADFSVIVDYAHTPDGLENILKTGRGLNPKRLIVVFGCGGDRDRTKRPIMGTLAAKMADYSIITSDNPRSENPEQIISEIEEGFIKANSSVNYKSVPDRTEAIIEAVNLAQTGDLVLIAGKGHETYQIFKDRTIHFDDLEVAQKALEARFHE